MDALRNFRNKLIRGGFVPLFLLVSIYSGAQELSYGYEDLGRNVNKLKSGVENWSKADLKQFESYIKQNLFQDDPILDSIIILSLRAEKFYYTEENAKNIHAKLKLISHYSSYIDSEYLEALNRKLAETYMVTGNYNLAESFFKESLKFSNDKVRSFVHSQIGSTFISRGDLGQAFISYDQALNFASGSFEKVSHLNSLGFICFLKGDLEKALDYYNRAMHLYDAANEDIEYIQLLIIRSNEFSVYRKMGNYEKCEELIHFFNHSEEFKESGQWFLREVYSKYTEYYLERENLVNAKLYISLLGELLLDVSLESELRYLKLKRDVELFDGSISEANHTVKKLDSIQEVLNLESVKQDAVIGEIQQSVYSDQLELIESNESLLKISNTRLTRVFIVSSILFLSIVTFVIVWFRLKRRRQLRKDAYLALKSDYLAEQEKMTELKAEMRKEEIKNKQLELNQLLNSINKYSSISSEVTKRLKSIKNKEGDIKDDLNQLLSFINATNKSNELMSALEDNTDSAYFGFKERVESNYPELTESEFQLVLLIRLGLKAKEIAQIRNVEPASVRIFKHRLKSKLKLSKETDLVEFIIKY